MRFQLAYGLDGNDGKRGNEKEADERMIGRTLILATNNIIADEPKVLCIWQHAFNYSSPPQQLVRCIPPAFESGRLLTRNERMIFFTSSPSHCPPLTTNLRPNMTKELTCWASKAGW